MKILMIGATGNFAKNIIPALKKKDIVVKAIVRNKSKIEIALQNGVDENENLLPTGYDFAKWLVDMDMDNIYKFPENFSFHVHSANPVGKANIEGYLNNYLNFR